MVKYGTATAVIVSLTCLEKGLGFTPSSFRQGSTLSQIRVLRTRTDVSVGADVDYFDRKEESKNDDFKQAIQDVGAAYMESLALDDEEEKALAERNRVLEKRRKELVYEVIFPIAGTDGTTPALGLTLREARVGRTLSDVVLNMDSMQLQSWDDFSTGSESFDLLDRSKVDVMDKNFSGIVVASVDRGSLAWYEGIRAGDTLVATSATMGKNLWPKSTLEGVRSAVSSRKMMGTIPMTFQFRRCDAHYAISEVAETYELTLSRPLGFDIKETDDGYVIVSGLSDIASRTVKYAVKPGDRVVAVDSAIGGNMWPVSSVAGVVSAVTGRLPGQSVTIKFERKVNVGDWEDVANGAPSNSLQSAVAAGSYLSGAVDGYKQLSSGGVAAKGEVGADSGTYSADSSAIALNGSKTREVLLSRCRDVLQRYRTENQSTTKDFKNKFSLKAIVADRVLEAIANASASLDAVTLSLIMNAYISCGQPDDAIRAFEAAVGISSDGSNALPTTTISSKKDSSRLMVADIDALDTFTATSLLQAYARKGDIDTVFRLICAMEGRPNFVVNGVKAADWAVHERIKMDSTCYNVALSAAAKDGSSKALDVALKIFNSMSEPRSNSANPPKTRASYNTMISAYSLAGRNQDAFAVLQRMKEAGLKPDKFSYTSLIKCVDQDDVKELFYDMQEQGIEADVKMYNVWIKMLCDRYKLYDAKQLVVDMEKRGLKPDSVTYTLLMNGLLKANKPSACIALFESAYSDMRTRELTETVEIYTTAIAAASAMKDHERALDLVARMSTAGIKPNIKTLTALLGACLSSGQSKYAVKVYEKIKQPDGYAMTMGVRAYCATEAFEKAAEIISGQRNTKTILSGKQIMASYNVLLRDSLQAGEFDVARRALSELLNAGYIPSKATYNAISDGLGVEIGGKRTIAGAIEEDEEHQKFDFLLFVLDSIAKRKLACDGIFYANILNEGVRIGALRKKMASILAWARGHTQTQGKQLHISGESEKLNKKGHRTTGWEELISNYSEYRDSVGKSIHLPPLRVQVSKATARHVFSAEKAVTYGKERAKFRRVEKANA